MDKLVALFWFVLSLLGVDAGTTTFVHRSSVDGRDALYSRAYVQPGVARFECLRSESGRCHYSIHPDDCPSPVAGPAAACQAGRVQRFTVALGDSRQVVGLQDFSLCVSADGGARVADCEAVGPPSVH